MNTFLSIGSGVVLGVLGTAPLAFALQRARKGHAPSVSQGFGFVVFSAIIIGVGIYAVYAIQPEVLISFAVAAVLTMLAAVFVLGLTVWHKLTASHRNER